MEFEYRYNFRHQEPDSTIIARHPRHIDGRERDMETSWRRKRREQAEETRAHA
jgi:hypothetical protein